MSHKCEATSLGPCGQMAGYQLVVNGVTLSLCYYHIKMTGRGPMGGGIQPSAPTFIGPLKFQASR